MASSIARLRAGLRALLGAPWVRLFLAVLALWALFGLPGLLVGVPESAIPSLELCLCVGLLSLAAGEARPLGFICQLAIALLFIERVDRTLLAALMGEVPLLYDQLFMLRHLFVLVSDLFSLRTLAVVLGVALGIALTVWIVRWALREIERFARTASIRRRAVVLLALVSLSALIAADRELRALFFQGPLVMEDLRASLQLYRSVRTRLRETLYAQHHAVELVKKPDVYLFVIESYGRLMYASGPDGDAHRARMLELSRSLDQLGFESMSAFSRAPVMGGRSWLAEASVLTGMRIRHEAVFRHLIEQMAGVPHLVKTLARNGYDTVLLAPSDRVRPGVEDVNYYGFDRVIRFDDLNYRGPAMGWGIVPDQYSIERTHEHVLQKRTRPLFLDFHMVSSHAPWEQIPQIVPDYRTLGSGNVQPEVDDSSMLGARIKRYARSKKSFRFLRKGLDQAEGQRDALRRYQQAISYEFDVLARYLPRIESDALIFVMGDHQPPLLLASSQDFAVPVHVLSRNESLLEPMREAGFVPGLLLHMGQREALRHEGMYSLLMRTLAIACGDGSEPPRYLSRGVRLGE